MERREKGRLHSHTHLTANVRRQVRRVSAVQPPAGFHRQSLQRILPLRLHDGIFVIYLLVSFLSYTYLRVESVVSTFGNTVETFQQSSLLLIGAWCSVTTLLSES